MQEITCSIFDSDALEVLRKRQRVDPHRIRLLQRAAFRKFESDAAIQRLVPFDEPLRLHHLEFAQRCDSSIDGATKFLLRTANGMLIESVLLRIASGRTTLCVSSQVGCAAACDFCATGKMGVAHNLAAAEILDQVLLAGQLLRTESRLLRNIVFMGMGEPFHNEDQLFNALEQLTSPTYFDHPPSRILVSTVGVTEGMIRCAKRFPDVNLAVSLHSINQATREKLIPLARKHPLDELRSAIEEVNHQQVMIEYLMLRDLNDSIDDARTLIEWLRGLDVHVNLIPFNAIEDAPHLVASDKATMADFSETLKSAGVKTTTRYSLGSDIAAACGQLVQQKNREIARSLATQSTADG